MYIFLYSPFANWIIILIPVIYLGFCNLNKIVHHQDLHITKHYQKMPVCSLFTAEKILFHSLISFFLSSEISKEFYTNKTVNLGQISHKRMKIMPNSVLFRGKNPFKCLNIMQE